MTTLTFTIYTTAELETLTDAELAAYTETLRTAQLQLSPFPAEVEADTRTKPHLMAERAERTARWAAEDAAADEDARIAAWIERHEADGYGDPAMDDAACYRGMSIF